MQGIDSRDCGGLVSPKSDGGGQQARDSGKSSSSSLKAVYWQTRKS